MAELYRSDIVNVDINKSLNRMYVGGVLATGDNKANRFGANVYRGGEPVNLDACGVTGYFIRPNMETVVVRGVAEGHTAYVDLEQACYACEGQFSLAIKVSSGGVVHTVRIVDGYIRQTQTDTMIDPGTAVPSLDDLFAQIAAMESATAEAEQIVATAKEDVDAAIARIEAKSEETTAAIKEEAAETIETVKADTDVAILAANKATADAIAATSELAGVGAPAIIETATGDLVSITDGAARPAVSLVTHIAPVQEGSGDPSPENVRPISGWTAVKAQRTGKNLYNGGDLSFTQRVRVYLAAPLQAGTYTMSALVESDDTDQTISAARLFGKNDNSLGFLNLNRGSYSTATKTVTEDIYSIRFYASGNDSNSENDACTWTSIMLNEGDTALPYEPYQGQTLTADLPETVYGGTLDWDTGVLTSTLDADGNTLPEPKVFQLTPQQLETLKGTNNVWSDTGDTDLTYIADTKLYIDRKIAAIAAATV